MYTLPRRQIRITLHRPFTVCIEDENALPLGYGVIPNVSEGGACLWSKSQLELGGRLVLRDSFGPQIYEVAARVVWMRELEDPLGGAPMPRCGLQWQDFSSDCVLRLLHLAREASGKKRTGSDSAVKPSPGLVVRPWTGLAGQPVPTPPRDSCGCEERDAGLVVA